MDELQNFIDQLKEIDRADEVVTNDFWQEMIVAFVNHEDDLNNFWQSQDEEGLEFASMIWPNIIENLPSRKLLHEMEIVANKYLSETPKIAWENAKIVLNWRN